MVFYNSEPRVEMNIDEAVGIAVYAAKFFQLMNLCILEVERAMIFMCSTYVPFYIKLEELAVKGKYRMFCVSHAKRPS